MRRAAREAIGWARGGGCALALAALAAGCGDSSAAPEPASLTGRWEGTVQLTGQSYTMDLVQDGAAVTGSGTVSDVIGTAGTTVTGSVSGYNVELVIALPNTTYAAIAFTGSFTRPDRVGGTLLFPVSQLRDTIVFVRR